MCEQMLLDLLLAEGFIALADEVSIPRPMAL